MLAADAALATTQSIIPSTTFRVSGRRSSNATAGDAAFAAMGPTSSTTAGQDGTIPGISSAYVRRITPWSPDYCCWTGIFLHCCYFSGGNNIRMHPNNCFYPGKRERAEVASRIEVNPWSETASQGVVAVSKKDHCTAGLRWSILRAPERRIGQRRDVTRASTQMPEWLGRCKPPRSEVILAEQR